MVAFDSRLKNNCVKTHPHNADKPPATSSSNSVCDSVASTKILLTPPVHKNRQTRVLIQSDMSQPQKIGLNVNTNVHLKPKKRYDCAHFISDFFILVLTIYAIISYLENQKLKGEVREMKLRFNLLEDSIKLNMEMMNNVINSIDRNRQQDVLEEEISKHLVRKRDVENVDEVERAVWNCSGSARAARSLNRGPLAMHLRGALPEITVRDGGIIAPWYIDKSSSGSFLLANGIVGERRGVFEVVEEGLYYIYAQMYYFTSSSLNSYSINVQLGEGRERDDSVIAVCSAEAAITKMSELSCFTATVRYLRRGDRLYVTQRERNRRIIFRDNQSFLGLVLLNSHQAVNNK